MLAYKIMLEGKLTLVCIHDRPGGSITHRDDSVFDTQAGTYCSSGFGQALALAQQCAAGQVNGQIPVTQAEPGLATQLLQCFQAVPALILAAPTQFRIAEPRERIGHGVQVRTHQ